MDDASSSTYEIADVYRLLRANILKWKPRDLSQYEARPFVAVVDMAYPRVMATLAVAADGSTSLYYSHGAAVCGTGSHDEVRAVSGAYFREIERNAEHVRDAEDWSLPQPGRVRFHLVSASGIRTTELPESDLFDPGHPLAATYSLAHAVAEAVIRQTPLGGPQAHQAAPERGASSE